MIPLIQQPLTPPAGNTQRPPGGEAKADSQRHAWEREMERAQTEAWFKPQRTAEPAQAHTPKTAPVARHAPEPSRAVDPKSQPANLAPAMGRSSAVHRVAPEAVLFRPASLIVPTRPAAAGLDTSRDVAAAGQVSPPPSFVATGHAGRLNGAVDALQASQRPPELLQPPALRQTVRMHAQWQGDAVAIWLGVDAGQMDQAMPLVDSLRQWLHGQGLRATRIVCNGQTLWCDIEPSPHDPRTDRDSLELPLPSPADLHFHITATRET
jgi:hypothetical protein